MAHVEIAASIFCIEENGQVRIEVEIDKSDLASILSKETKCNNRDKISNCGRDFIKNHVTILKDTSKVELEMYDFEIGKERVSFSFKLDSTLTSISDFSVKSSLMKKFHEHSIVRVFFINGASKKSYSLRTPSDKANRKK